MTNYALSQLPERFKTGPKSKTLLAYIDRKYSTYGYRKARNVEYNPEFKPEWSKHNHYRWIENASKGLRDLGPVHELARKEGWHARMWDTQGFYVDSFQSDTAVPHVIQLPARNGEPIYTPAIADPWNNDAFITDFRSTTSELRDAASWAMSIAETYADMRREDEAKQSAEQRREEIAEEIKTAYADLRTLCTEIRANCDKLTGMDETRKLIRAEVRRVRREVAKLRKESRNLEENYWNAVPQW